MDISIDNTTKDKIYEISKLYKDIQNVTKIISSPIGNSFSVSLNISVDGNMSTFESHSLADNLKKDLLKVSKVSLVIIHVNPV